MIRNEATDATTGVTTTEIVDLAAGLFVVEVDGVEVERRALTPREVTLWTPPPPTPEERLDTLVADLAKATTLAQVRAAAAKAAET